MKYFVYGISPIKFDTKYNINELIIVEEKVLYKKVVSSSLKLQETRIIKIDFSQLKFLYPLKTLVFPAFSPPRFGPFPSFFPL